MKHYLAINRHEVFDTRYTMDEHWKHNTKSKKPSRKSMYGLTLFYEM